MSLECAPLPQHQPRIRIAEHIEVAWASGTGATAGCANCGFVGPMNQRLEIDYRPPDAEYFYRVQSCNRCGALCFDNTETMDYSTSDLIEIGWHTYQIQIGAGVWSIAQPLTRIDKPAGAKILEIGGAYGFGLDFGIRARQWQGEGFDPSPLSVFGVTELGLKITQEYFEARHLDGRAYDVIVATEVIEHLASPQEFFQIMRRALTVDGILMLTTPNAELITPDCRAEDLLPMLSPGAHLVLQTPGSLDYALRAAGFAYVEVHRSSFSVVAYASGQPFVLNQDAAQARAVYRHYLVERSFSAKPESDLRLGFSGRGYFEAMNDADDAAATAAWQALVPAVKQRFGLDLESMATLPSAVHGCSLAELGHVMPLGLGMILYSRGVYLLSHGAQRGNVLPVFQLSLAALDALQSALAQRSLSDGLAASLRFVVESEIIFCLVALDDPGWNVSLNALMSEKPSASLIWRVFIDFMNAASLRNARELQAQYGLFVPEAELPSPLRADAYFCLGNLSLQDEDGAGRAATLFGNAREILRSQNSSNPPADLFWHAVRGEIIALHRLNRSDLVTELLHSLIPQFDGAPEDLLEQLKTTDTSIAV
jgi:SAM-dependent methyltransferase